MDGTEGNGSSVTPSTNEGVVAQVTTQTEAAPVVAAPQQEAQTTSTEDMSKIYAIVGYILPFLFFLPLVSDGTKNNAFARFHANQQLILLIAWVAIYVVSNMLYMVLYMIAGFILPLINLGFLVLAIMGIINAVKGEMKELPVIGKFKILK
jgi:uncharacterized membrane protein